MPRPALSRRLVALTASALLLLLAAELFLSVRQDSQTFDESAHLYSGYAYWKTGDFGINPEHPPFAKLVAALPLLPTHLAIHPPPPIFFRASSGIAGRGFLYSNNADQILLRSRMTISVFTFALALLVFFAAYEMFGPGAALFALLLLVFEPNILAHGALITTDMGLTAMLFASVYTFYRWTRQPSLPRLLLCALAVGLTLAVKHSGLIVFPILILLAVADLALRHIPAPQPASEPASEPASQPASDIPSVPAVPARPPYAGVLRTLGALLLIAVIAITILWAFYGFRYAARPGHQPFVPSASDYLADLSKLQPTQARLIGFAERHHLLPEAYLFGLTDIAFLTASGRPSFLFGRLYPEGRWFYFPSTFIIKSTLAFLVLLALVLAARSLWRRSARRELIFLAVPPALFFLAAMHSHLDIGHRHILPIYPFLILLAAAAAWSLARQSRGWAWTIAILLAFHAASSLRAFPNYLPYSNEAWGGPANTYKVLSDSNVGWAGGLKAMQLYVADHHITHCWFAYNGVSDLSYFHLPCAPLPTFFSMIVGTPQPVVPVHLDGPVFIATEAINGMGWGPRDLTPYSSLIGRKPDAVIQGEILVYNGSFDAPRISAVSHFLRANQLLRAQQPLQAFAEAQQAEALAPELLFPHEMLTSLYAAGHHSADAAREYALAQHLYTTTYAHFQGGLPPPVDPVTNASTH